MTRMRPMLAGLVQAAGAVPVDLGVLPDEAQARARRRSRVASQRYNVLVISGGASLGAEDHVVHAIDALGKRHLWQIAIKPGRPMSFGQIGDCVVLGLPGNPVAVFVCFLLYVRPVLAVLAGRRLARAGALSDLRCLLAEEEGRAARVLARATHEQGWSALR